jgi:Tfp pilus assembly protein PilN
VSEALNLARRPFRNERLPTLLLAAGCAVLAAVTLHHGFVARDLLPGRAQDKEREAVALESELLSLREEVRKLRGAESAPAPLVKEWAAVKELVDRRAFSWTGLLADLEEAVPPEIRLVSIAPRVERGQHTLALAAVGREVDDALALYAALSGHRHFRSVQLDGYSEADAGLEIRCHVGYAPPRTRQAKAGAPPPGVPPAETPAGPPGAAP